MNQKKKGTNGERELIHFFWAAGWAAIRVAGSGSSRYPCPDLVVGKAGRKLAVECKVTKENIKYFPEDEIEALKQFATIFGAEPWLAVRFPRQEWRFVAPDELQKTGKLYSFPQELALRRGLLFEEFSKS